MSRQDSQAAFNAAYQKLNPEQKHAVDSIEGPVMVVAGPGTGKTQILTLRIANILKETDIRPENILALTFTNAGVRAMRERLQTYIKDEAYRVGIFTFHSFAEHVLQAYSSYFPEREGATVISDLEKARLIEDILTQYEFSDIVSVYDRFSSLRQIMGAIDDIKQEGLQPHEFEALLAVWEESQLADESMFYKRKTGQFQPGDAKPAEVKKVKQRVAKARELATVFAAYQAALERERRYDFSDMILSVLRGLEKNADLKFDLQEQYQYVLVDEHQDTNEGQNRLVELLVDAEHLDGRPNLFTVGDEKQSIYRFQGASDQTFEHFKRHFKDVELIELEQNYRSTEPILSAAHTLITHSLPDAKSLQSNQSEHKPITVREFSDYKFELLYVVEDIKRKLETGIDPEDIAIIYRSNKHLSEIKTLLHQADIPYHVRSRDTLLDDPLITHLILLFKVIANPADDAALGRLLFASFWGLDSLLVSETLRAHRSQQRDASQAAPLIEHLRKLPEFASVTAAVSTLQGFAANHTFVETFKEALDVSGFLKYSLQLPDSRSALRKVEVLFNEVRQQAERTSAYGVSDFVTFVEATEKYGLAIEVTAARVGKGVQCMTAHGSKGLEFEHVYLVNTARTNWEKSRGGPSFSLPLAKWTGELDDERRLFYVAITRAKRGLTITSAKQDWSGKALEPSQFIAELDEAAVESEPTQSFEAEHADMLVRFLERHPANESVFDPEYLAARFNDENISVTALNNFIECPIQYLFRNLIQLPDVYTPALRYGDAVHRALERFFLSSVEAGLVLPKEALLDAFEHALATSGFPDADFDRFRTKGRQALGMYHDYYHDSWTVQVSLEEYIKRGIEIDGQSLTLSGKIDKLEFRDSVGSGPVRVVDYKTGKPYSQKGTKAQREALERQIRFYHLLLEGYRDDVRIESAVLDFVEPTDENEFEQKTMQVSDEDIETLKQEIGAMAEAVLSGDFLQQGCGKKDCESCAFWATLSR